MQWYMTKSSVANNLNYKILSHFFVKNPSLYFDFIYVLMYMCVHLLSCVLKLIFSKVCMPINS